MAVREKSSGRCRSWPATNATMPTMAHSTRAEKMKVRIPEKWLMFFVLTGMLSIMPCLPVEYFCRDCCLERYREPRSRPETAAGATQEVLRSACDILLERHDRSFVC